MVGDVVYVGASDLVDVRAVQTAVRSCRVLSWLGPGPVLSRPSAHVGIYFFLERSRKVAGGRRTG